MDLVLWSSLKFGQVGDRVQKPKNFVVVICTWLQRGRRGPEWTPTDPPQAHFYGCHAMPFLPSSAKIVEQIFHPRKRLCTEWLSAAAAAFQLKCALRVRFGVRRGHEIFKTPLSLSLSPQSCEKRATCNGSPASIKARANS